MTKPSLTPTNHFSAVDKKMVSSLSEFRFTNGFQEVVRTTDWNEFNTAVDNNIVWTGEKVFVAKSCGFIASYLCHFKHMLSIITPTGDLCREHRIGVFALDSNSAASTIDSLFQLIARSSGCEDVTIEGNRRLALAIPFDTLTDFLCSPVQKIRFEKVILNEQHCYAIEAAVFSSTLQIHLDSCTVEGEGLDNIEETSQGRLTTGRLLTISSGFEGLCQALASETTGESLCPRTSLFV
jgi:hypothetical protein